MIGSLPRTPITKIVVVQDCSRGSLMQVFQFTVSNTWKPKALRFSVEVDVDPKNRPDKVDAIDSALGEGSRFHETHGFYVHGVSIETAILARGWEGRTRPIRSANTLNRTGHCLEAHDLAASKRCLARQGPGIRPDPAPGTAHRAEPSGPAYQSASLE